MLEIRLPGYHSIKSQPSFTELQQLDALSSAQQPLEHILEPQISVSLTGLEA